MAYSMTESPVDYHPSERYAQYTGLRKGNVRNDYDAPVASHHAIYSAAVEQQLERSKDLRQPPRSQKVSSQPITHAPSIVTLEQRSRSLDQGSSKKDVEALGQKQLNIAQQEAFKALTEGSRVDKQKEKDHAKEVDWNTRFIRGGHQPSKSLADDSSKSSSCGLPANPRPDPHRRLPSLDRTNIQPLREEDTSGAAQNHNPSNYQAVYQKKPSYQYSEESSISRKASSDTRKGSSSSQRGETNHPVTLFPAAMQIPQDPKIGTRKVKVICDQISFTLPVTPLSTAKDVLSATRDRLGEGFDMRRYSLVESYRQLGSERPLRHFERIHDVLDSWDSDDKDSLLIQPLHAQWEHESLDLENAPKLIPSNMTANLYYSHRPESWHKWTFTLRIDGQIVMQKYSGGDFKAVCHLKDCDIYIPTSRQMKKLAPPRKFCFAIKSQQKSTSYTDASNFVHFFSTSDEEVASEWYRAVHGWRSYYLVHMKEVQKTQSTIPSASSHVDVIPQRNASLPRGDLRKGSTEKPLPRLDQSLVSTSGNGVSRQDTRGQPSIFHERTGSTSHNRSISADRGQRLPSSHIRGLSEPAESSTAQVYARNGYVVRKPSAPTRSDSVPFIAHGQLPARILPEKSFAPSANSLQGQSHIMRKQTSMPGSIPDPTMMHHYRYGKSSADLGTERKLSDDASSHVYPETTSPRPEWKFDPYTGKPITSAWPNGTNASTIQESAVYPPQVSTVKDMYIMMGPSDRKFSNESSDGYFVPIHQGPAQDYRAVNDIIGIYHTATNDTRPHNHMANQPWVNPEQEELRGQHSQSGRTHDVTTTTGERFF